MIPRVRWQQLCQALDGAVGRDLFHEAVGVNAGDAKAFPEVSEGSGRGVQVLSTRCKHPVDGNSTPSRASLMVTVLLLVDHT